MWRIPFPGFLTFQLSLLNNILSVWNTLQSNAFTKRVTLFFRILLKLRIWFSEEDKTKNAISTLKNGPLTESYLNAREDWAKFWYDSLMTTRYSYSKKHKKLCNWCDRKAKQYNRNTTKTLGVWLCLYVGCAFVYKKSILLKTYHTCIFSTTLLNGKALRDTVICAI